MHKNAKRGFEAYRKKVNQKLAAIRPSYVNMVEAASMADAASLKLHAEAFADACDSLLEILPQENLPRWIKVAQNFARSYSTHSETPTITKRLIKHLNANAGKLELFNWEYDHELEGTPDLEAIISEELNENEINEKFEAIVAELHELAKSDALDAEKAQGDLMAVIAMLSKAGGSGYAEKIFTWNFARRYIPNLLVELSKNIPVVKESLAAFEKTAEEMDMAFDNVKHSVADRFYDQVKDSLSLPDQEAAKSSIKMLPYSGDDDGQK